MVPTAGELVPELEFSLSVCSNIYCASADPSDSAGYREAIACKNVWKKG